MPWAKSADQTTEMNFSYRQWSLQQHGKLSVHQETPQITESSCRAPEGNQRENEWAIFLHKIWSRAVYHLRKENETDWAGGCACLCNMYLEQMTNPRDLMTSTILKILWLKHCETWGFCSQGLNFYTSPHNVTFSPTFHWASDSVTVNIQPPYMTENMAKHNSFPLTCQFDHTFFL